MAMLISSCGSNGFSKVSIEGGNVMNFVLCDDVMLKLRSPSSMASQVLVVQSSDTPEFVGGRTISHGSASRSSSSGLTTSELLLLPTGPRERSAMDLDCSSRGLGYSAYGNGGARRMEGSSSRDSWDDAKRNVNLNKDSTQSRADEVDDWSAMKRSAGPLERRERGGRFFDSQSRSDEADSWISKRGSPPKNLRQNCGVSEMIRYENPVAGRVDSDTWIRKKDEGIRADSNGGGRPKLILLPRSVPLNNGNTKSNNEVGLQAHKKGSNPFGLARPREEVLAEKGMNWKTNDEKMDSDKLRGVPEDQTGRSWRKECLSGSH